MKFDLKDMYKFLLSHTFPGLLLGGEVILSIFLFTDFTVKYYNELLKKDESLNILQFMETTWVKQTVLMIIAGYVLSTLLGFVIDGIHHFFYEDICYEDAKSNKKRFKIKFGVLLISPNKDMIRQEAAESSYNKFKAISNEHALSTYKHFVEDDLWYPSEAYANIAIAMLFGVLMLIYAGIGGRNYISWRYVLIVIFGFFTWVMLFEASNTLAMHEVEEEQFVSVFSNENKMQAEIVVRGYDPDLLRDIMLIERRSFPITWIETDAEERYKRALSTADNINIILTAEGKRVGYLLAVPHNDAVRDLKGDDPAMKEDSKKYYIETVGILPEFRGRKGLSIMIEKLVNEIKKRGITRISLHARVTNRLSEIIQNKFRATEVRRIEKWAYYNYEEPTDYIEASL